MSFKNQVLEPLKLALIQRYVESRGFFLGEHITLLPSSPRGPLLVCEHPPNNEAEMIVMGLLPGELVDHSKRISMRPFHYKPTPIKTVKTPLSMSLFDAYKATVRAMAEIEIYKKILAENKAAQEARPSN
ncbi:MAG: hypothetical protein ABIO72_03675 [Patescibacteria group bacterium]